ncbi:lactococcin 972 family bacteriocin [Streptomyces nojiriensis]|uniref:lactococcin 972 family bacteriocin n=1 Tax=Streptomyces nojiriensis TaxID=66374 RepID=UPI0035DBF665
MISRKSIVLGFAAALLAVGGLATPSVADTRNDAIAAGEGAVVAADGAQVGQIVVHKRGDGAKPPAELGNPSEWGEVVLKITPSNTFSPMSTEACVPASGGNWCYGYYYITTGKHCYSNYYHSSKTHKTSVEFGNWSGNSGWVNSGETAYTAAEGGAAFTCKTYYSIQ